MTQLLKLGHYIFLVTGIYFIFDSILKGTKEHITAIITTLMLSYIFNTIYKRITEVNLEFKVLEPLIEQSFNSFSSFLKKTRTIHINDLAQEIKKHQNFIKDGYFKATNELLEERTMRTINKKFIEMVETSNINITEDKKNSYQEYTYDKKNRYSNNSSQYMNSSSIDKHLSILFETSNVSTLSKTKSDIKKQFRKMAKKYHPDTSSFKNSSEKFQEVKESYDYLILNIK